ncbi:MAG: hypothetical protein ABJB11_08415 [Ferruginibacter sp.]
MNDKEIIDIFLLLDAGTYPDWKLYDCETYKAAINGDLILKTSVNGSTKTKLTSAKGKPVIQKVPVVKSKPLV